MSLFHGQRWFRAKVEGGALAYRVGGDGFVRPVRGAKVEAYDVGEAVDLALARGEPPPHVSYQRLAPGPLGAGGGMLAWCTGWGLPGYFLANLAIVRFEPRSVRDDREEQRCFEFLNGEWQPLDVCPPQGEPGAYAHAGPGGLSFWGEPRWTLAQWRQMVGAPAGRDPYPNQPAFWRRCGESWQSMLGGAMQLRDAARLLATDDKRASSTGRYLVNSALPPMRLVSETDPAGGLRVRWAAPSLNGLLVAMLVEDHRTGAAGLCDGCGVYFQRPRPNARYCNPGCRNRTGVRRHRERAKAPRRPARKGRAT